MISLKAHFDGTAIVLDEPATLSVGQRVEVVIDSTQPSVTFAERVLLPEFESLPWKAGDVTRDISADRDHTEDRAA